MEIKETINEIEEGQKHEQPGAGDLVNPEILSTHPGSDAYDIPENLFTCQAWEREEFTECLPNETEG